MTQFATSHTKTPKFSYRRLFFLAFVVAFIGLTAFLANRFASLSTEDPLLLDSTLGDLAVWMAGQTEQEEIESVLGQVAEDWAQSLGQESIAPEPILESMRSLLVGWTGLTAVLAGIGIILVIIWPQLGRPILLLSLVGIDCLLLIVPFVDNTIALVLLAIALLLVALLLSDGKVTKVLGFFVALSTILIVWEVAKFAASTTDYKITVAQASYDYAKYPSLEDALTALENGEVNAVIVDRRDLAELAPPYPPDASVDAASLPYPSLRYLTNVDTNSNVAGFALIPEYPTRLGIAVREADAPNIERLNQVSSIATVEGEFADTDYLVEPRSLLLADLKILNDLNLPHLQTIAEALMQPARRNGSQLLIRILGEAAGFTFGEAFWGFVYGAILGFTIGTVLAHSKLLERSLLPYVVASQTVPILAIAPMVVVWLGASAFSVAVIAAYLTFFPVAINTLRGLLSPKPTAVELMESYAASWWTILWKLRVPAAMPYIFTALKVSATASVVGAIIGELPSGMSDGLGRAILNFSSDYSLVSTPKLWGAIFVAATVGIFFFLMVTVIERIVVGRYIRAG
jgi:NitT/TauT family transport system permease protein